MKTNIIILMALAALSLPSCRDYLDEIPDSRITVDTDDEVRHCSTQPTPTAPSSA